MKKVYLVVEEYTTDFDKGNDIKVFKDYNDAKKYFNERLEDVKQMSYDVFNIVEDSCEAYVDGEYTYYHTCLNIVEKEVL